MKIIQNPRAHDFACEYCFAVACVCTHTHMRTQRIGMGAQRIRMGATILVPPQRVLLGPAQRNYIEKGTLPPKLAPKNKIGLKFLLQKVDFGGRQPSPVSIGLSPICSPAVNAWTRTLDASMHVLNLVLVLYHSRSTTTY